MLGGQPATVTNPGWLACPTTTAGYIVSIPGGYNGGGNGADECDVPGQPEFNETVAPGGGATDIRIVSGTWENVSSLNSRIAVAAGGSGSYNINNAVLNGWPGGAINSDVIHQYFNLKHTTTQTGGYSFGKGYNGNSSFSSTTGDMSSTGGGGGYYGGNGTTIFDTASTSNTVSAGGASFISGHTGSVAIKSANDQTPKAGCTSGTTNNSCLLHYSGYTFTNTTMIDGAGYGWTNVKGNLVQMPKPNGSQYASGSGHTGNGYAKITLIRIN